MENFRYELLADNHPSGGWWWPKVIDIFNRVDTGKVLIHTNYDFTPYVLDKKYQFVIKSLGYEETPRLNELVAWCNMNPDVHFFCLADMNSYDFPLPLNLEFVDYRLFYVEIAQLLELYRDQIIPVKNKKFKYKFSSLSHRKRQFRAVITAKLLACAKHDSIVSWHNKNNDTSGIHEYLIDSVRQMNHFRDLDWSFLDNNFSVDTYEIGKNDFPDLILDFRYPAYQEAFINITNETFWFGLHQTDQSRYITPGPYMSEKTWKCIASGTMFVNTGQPFTYSFLRRKYGIPIDFDFDMSFDNITGDIDRMVQVCNTIDSLCNRSLDDLVESNIDACEKMQQWILQPELLQNFIDYNKKQDEYILEKIQSI